MNTIPPELEYVIGTTRAGLEVTGRVVGSTASGLIKVDRGDKVIAVTPDSVQPAIPPEPPKEVKPRRSRKAEASPAAKRSAKSVKAQPQTKVDELQLTESPDSAALGKSSNKLRFEVGNRCWYGSSTNTAKIKQFSPCRQNVLLELDLGKAVWVSAKHCKPLTDAHVREPHLLEPGTIVKGQDLDGKEHTGKFTHLSMSGMALIDDIGKRRLLVAGTLMRVEQKQDAANAGSRSSFSDDPRTKKGSLIRVPSGDRAYVEGIDPKDSSRVVIKYEAAQLYRDPFDSYPLHMLTLVHESLEAENPRPKTKRAQRRTAPTPEIRFLRGDRVKIAADDDLNNCPAIVDCTFEAGGLLWTAVYCAELPGDRLEYLSSNLSFVAGSTPSSLLELERLMERKTSQKPAQADDNGLTPPDAPTAEDVQAAIVPGDPQASIARLFADAGFVRDWSVPTDELNPYKNWQIATDSPNEGMIAVCVCTPSGEWWGRSTEEEFDYSDHKGAIDWAMAVVDRLAEVERLAAEAATSLEPATAEVTPKFSIGDEVVTDYSQYDRKSLPPGLQGIQEGHSGRVSKVKTHGQHVEYFVSFDNIKGRKAVPEHFLRFAQYGQWLFEKGDRIKDRSGKTGTITGQSSPASNYVQWDDGTTGATSKGIAELISIGEASAQQSHLSKPGQAIEPPTPPEPEQHRSCFTCTHRVVGLDQMYKCGLGCFNGWLAEGWDCVQVRGGCDRWEVLAICENVEQPIKQDFPDLKASTDNASEDSQPEIFRNETVTTAVATDRRSELLSRIDFIRKEGNVAPAGCWLEQYHTSKKLASGEKKTFTYWRVRADKPIFEIGDRQVKRLHLGSANSTEYEDWSARLDRRRRINEIETEVDRIERQRQAGS